MVRDDIQLRRSAGRNQVLIHLLIALVTIAASVTPNRATSQDADYAFNGVYLGLGGTWGVYTELEDEIQSALASLGYSSPVDVETPIGLNARLGYRFHPRAAGEVQFEWLPGADVRFLGTNALQLESWTLTANAKGYILTGRFQPFLLVGVGATHFDVSDRLGLGLSADEVDFAARFGGGIEFYVTRHVVLALDATYALAENVDDQRTRKGNDARGLNHFSLGWGLQYRF